MYNNIICSCFSCADSPDFILVRDGVDSTGPVIAQYCNTRNGEQVISSGRNIYIDFIVDERKQRQGFAATFEYIKAESIPQKTGPGRRPNPTDDSSFPNNNKGENFTQKEKFKGESRSWVRLHVVHYGM